MRMVWITWWRLIHIAIQARISLAFFLTLADITTKGVAIFDTPYFLFPYVILVNLAQRNHIVYWRPRFHFTRKRIEAHICICFVALKVYKELERMLKVSEIKMSVDKVLALAKTITTIQIKLPLNKEVYTQTMLMARHQKIAKLFDEEFWVTRWRSQDNLSMWYFPFQFYISKEDN